MAAMSSKNPSLSVLPFFVLKDWKRFPGHAEALETRVLERELLEEEDRKELPNPNRHFFDPIMYSHA